MWTNGTERVRTGSTALLFCCLRDLESQGQVVLAVKVMTAPLGPLPSSVLQMSLKQGPYQQSSLLEKFSPFF